MSTTSFTLLSCQPILKFVRKYVGCVSNSLPWDRKVKYLVGMTLACHDWKNVERGKLTLWHVNGTYSVVYYRWIGETVEETDWNILHSGAFGDCDCSQLENSRFMLETPAWTLSKC
ncbi:uncharacterized protein LOC132044034 [Lycium ferocissimum]|uniref:uncharacterized protein LOC132044034 n=1 Tax=Lycium ferocissimum TaxID=112874 RepID=UPI0028149F01|nr:uncharacterized protein LOC132044034 [Lycium ferocissimum]